MSKGSNAGLRMSWGVVCLWILLFALPMPGAGRPKYGGTLRLSFFQTAESYDPALAATLPEKIIARAVYETLVALDDGGAPAPALAAVWNAESGGKRWVFQLRAGIRFHNGAPLNAAAVRASLEKSVAQAQTAAAVRLRRVQLLCASPAPARLACDMAEALPLPAMLADPALAIVDADGAGTGPFKVASWSRGARIRLEAFEAYPRGRPFLDAVEAEFSSDARRQRVEFELRRAEVVVSAPTEARVPGLLRNASPANLLLAGFAASPRGREARRLLQAALDRDALARLLPPREADAASAFLPGWMSGYEFLFARPAAHALEGPPAQGTLRLVYDESDPVARLIASRLVLDLRSVGADLSPGGLPHAGFAEARQTGRYDLYLESVRLRADNPAAALADLLLRQEEANLAGDALTMEAQYRLERAALESPLLLPLLHYRDRFSSQPALEQVRLDEAGMLDLANAWKR